MLGACDHYCAVLYFHAEIEKGIFCGLVERANATRLRGVGERQNERFFRAVMCVRKYRDIEHAMNHANDHAKRVSKIKEIKIAHTNRKQP